MSSKTQLRGLTSFVTSDNQPVHEGKAFWIDQGEGKQLIEAGLASADLTPASARKMAPRPLNKMMATASNK